MLPIKNSLYGFFGDDRRWFSWAEGFHRRPLPPPGGRSVLCGSCSTERGGGEIPSFLSLPWSHHFSSWSTGATTASKHRSTTVQLERTKTLESKATQTTAKRTVERAIAPRDWFPREPKYGAAWEPIRNGHEADMRLAPFLWD